MSSANPPANDAAPPKSRKALALRIFLALIALAVVVGFCAWLYERNYESTDDAFIDGHVISISPKVEGIVQHIYVDDNQSVKAGQVLLAIDPSDYQAALVQAQGNFAAAQGKVLEAQAQIDVDRADVGQAQAELAVAQTNADNSDRDYQRWVELDARARSVQQMDDATASQKRTAALVVQAKAKITAALAQVADAEMNLRVAQANVLAAKGALDEAQDNVNYCTIRAQTDGLITRKSAEEGQYVQVDEQLLSLVPTDVWVTANFKETQLDRIAPGQEAWIDVDAYPGRRLHGVVQSVQDGTGSRFSLLPPENATGNYVKVVQRVPVKIILDPGSNDDMQHLLAPGMSVDPTVKVR